MTPASVVRAGQLFRPLLWLCFLWFAPIPAATGQSPAPRFTPLIAAPTPRIIRSAEGYPASNFRVEHILDDRILTEYASNGKGTETFIDFDFGEPIRLAAFHHVDRQDVATVDEAALIFSDQPDFTEVLATVAIDHVNQPGGRTVATFAPAPAARYVRWQVTRLNAAGHSCAGGRDIGFFVAGEGESSPGRLQLDIQARQALEKTSAGPARPLTVTLDYPYVEPIEVLLHVGDRPAVELSLTFGRQSSQLSIPAPQDGDELPVRVDWNGKTVVERQFTLRPVRDWELHFLPHSHVDIGYTHVQTEVEQMQWKYLRQAIQIARNTADYPPEARFKWNSEVLWAVDSYLEQASDADREEFVQAVRDGVIHLDALYGNQLTALCRPEELFQLVACARRLARQYDLDIDAAMISDVPGYTWGLVPALAQSGIKYLSIGPNHIHRIGLTLDQWGDRPFYWVSPSGQDRVLCWMAGKAYSWFHDSRVGILRRDSRPDPFFDYLDELIEQEYPYELVQIRYSIGGDNGPPDQELSEFVKAWNERYERPRMIISTTRQTLRALEDRYADRIPEARGDFTPYWEDGAASSARETAMTRMAAERLVQAETLWAILDPETYPSQEFRSAWRDVLLYNEHTWGAHCSISQPDSPFTLSQWSIKQAFAVEADRKSRGLLDRALGRDNEQGSEDGKPIDAVDVFNTCSWPRDDMVVLDVDAPLAGYVVKDPDGNVIPSERTPGGQLAFLATQVPPLGAKRYWIEAGAAYAGRARAENNVLTNERLKVEIDSQTGAIASVRWLNAPVDLVDTTSGSGWNDYRYVAGRVADETQASRVKRLEVLTSGGLTASIAVHADAPGCRQLITVVRLVEGLERLDIINAIDKEGVLSPESVHLGFPFHVPNGEMRINIPWAVIRPNEDQLPGSCKNYLTAGRWVDVSNGDFGVTWATLDAPLIQVGGIHVDVDSPLSSGNWIRHLEPTQTLYSYLMNNYWETNYRASQEGMTTFRYSVWPHRQYEQVAAERFAVEQSQPLIAVPARRDAPVPASRLQLSGSGVVATLLKPGEDAGVRILRLFNPGTEPATTTVQWSEPAPSRITLSSPREEAGPEVSGPIEIPPLGIVTLRAEWARN
jgi:alpha-mannosidase